MRVFVATAAGAPEPSGLTRALALLPGGDWRVVPPARRHLTLRFVGEWPDAKITALARHLGAALTASRAGTLQLRGLGCFPSPRRPTVLWAGVQGGGRLWDPLAAAVDAGVRAAGCGPHDHPAVPHLTLARVPRSAEPARARDSAARLLAGFGDAPWGPVSITEVLLLRSDLGAGGPIYTKLAHWSLPE